jgi:hypothetical protein
MTTMMPPTIVMARPAQTAMVGEPLSRVSDTWQVVGASRLEQQYGDVV